MQGLFTKIEGVKEELAGSTEYERVPYRQGYIQAFRDALQVDFEQFQEEKQ